MQNPICGVGGKVGFKLLRQGSRCGGRLEHSCRGSQLPNLPGRLLPASPLPLPCSSQPPSNQAVGSSSGAGARLHPPGLWRFFDISAGAGALGCFPHLSLPLTTSERRVEGGVRLRREPGRGLGDGCRRREGTSEEQEGRRQGPGGQAGTEILRAVPADLRLGGCALSLRLSLPASLPSSLLPLFLPLEG